MSAIRRPDLSRLHSKATVKCECGLVQFQTGTTCRRCGVEFEEREEIELPRAPLQFVSKVKLEPLPKPEFKIIVTNHKIDAQVALTLKLIRVTYGLTQDDVAERVGNDRVHVSRMETGKSAPLVSTLESYCAAFGITPYGLLVIAEAIQ